MSSSEQEGTSAAAEQLGRMSLGESGERKDNETESTTSNGTTPTKLCSACGKKSDGLMKCRACKCVWYCDKDCQNKHWKEHKKECRRIKKTLENRGGKLDLGTEMDVGPLEKLPPREECPICMQTLPIHAGLHSYSVCCGKTICSACGFQHQLRSRELGETCAFCRTALSDSDEEILAQLRKRVERKDPEALSNMGMCYDRGEYGLPVNQAKCLELLREAVDLGYPNAQYKLGAFYRFGEMGLEKNEEEGIKYWEKAAEGGHVPSRHDLGCIEDVKNGDHVAAMRHFRLAASGGFKDSMENLIQCFDYGFLHHGDLAETLQAFYLSRAELKSKDRDEYIKYLKMTGKYEEEYDC